MVVAESNLGQIARSDQILMVVYQYQDAPFREATWIVGASNAVLRRRSKESSPVGCDLDGSSGHLNG